MTTGAELNKPLLGIGSCLAGHAVRYNGDTNPPNRHVRELCAHFETQDFCPEMGIGLGVPRPPIHLVGSADFVRVLDVETHSHDYTEQLRAFAQGVLAQAPELCGYILVKGSPSCGYGRVKRYSPEGEFLAADQYGMFAAALAAADPLLPLEDDGRLNDPGIRESFVVRACAYYEWKALCRDDLSAHRLIEFYSRYKYLVMAHHIPGYKALGPLLANAGRPPLQQLATNFIKTLMAALTHRATRRSHSNVLFHIAGYLKQRIDREQRQQLCAAIEAYRTGKAPLAEALTLLRRHFADNPNAYIDRQVYLRPYPDASALREIAQSSTNG